MPGLEGEHEIDLQFTAMPPQSTPQEATAPDYLGVAGSFASELEKQCGIHVEARKAPIDMLVMDRVDRAPSED
jgi:uncharacterized protein (TIGR03435 family)